MSNAKGVYAGVILRCQLEKVTEERKIKVCPQCKSASHLTWSCCPYCGIELETKYHEVEVYPYAYNVYNDESERMYWIMNEKDSEQGIVNFASNTNIFGTDSDFGNKSTVVTPELIAKQIEGFKVKHKSDIKYLEGRCVTCEVVWAIVPWQEF